MKTSSKDANGAAELEQPMIQLIAEVDRLRRQLALSEETIDRYRFMEEELRESEARYRSLVENMQAGVFIVQDEKTLFVNSAFANIVGCTAEEVCNNHLLDYVAPEDRELIANSYLSGDIKDGTSGQIEFHLLHKNGKTRIPAIINVGTFLYRDRHATIGTIKDLTEVKRGEQERRKLEDQLRHSQKMEAIGVLAGGVAHDMNNVLSAIMGLASVLREEIDSSDPKSQDVENILAATRRGRDLTKNLLGFARKGKYRKENISFGRIVDGIKGLLLRTMPKSVELRLIVDEDLPPIEGDYGQLTHALMNICINAIEAMSTGGMLTISTVRIDLEEQDVAVWPDLKPGPYALIQVIDTGCGMEKTVLDHAFEPFFTTKTREEGTGLGLSMVYGTIKNHGGSVVIDSTPGKGTTVSIYLPLILKAIADKRSSGDFSPMPRSRPMSMSGNVLVVDDEEMIRSSAKRLIEKLGPKVFLAASGEEAIEIFQANRNEISLVILDLLMPGMDGEETFFKLRAIDPKVPVLISSGYTREGKAEDLLRAGATGFLQKPFDLHAISMEILGSMR